MDFLAQGRRRKRGEEEGVEKEKERERIFILNLLFCLGPQGVDDAHPCW